MKKKTNFIQIASYRDPQLIPTLHSLIDNAEHPENLFICVCWQHADDENVEMFLDEGFDIDGYDEDESFKSIKLKYKKASIRLLDVHYLKTKGACWARNAIQQYYNGEKYTMQLDSHHRFVENWDTILIDMLESVRKDSPKPLLTAYIPSFDPENDPAMRQQEPWKMNFDRFIPEGAVFFLPATIDDWKERDKPMRARFFSAHFAFADGSFAEEVQHDPEYFFHGEEISIAARAWTHGYDLYHPHRLVAWHEYTRKGRIKVWDDHTTPQRTKGRIDLDWVQRNDSCHLRNRTLFGMKGIDPKSIDFGKYGFGKIRTLRDYEEYAGISFEFEGIQQITMDNIEPVVPYKHYTDEIEWKDSFVRSNDYRILFNRNELIHTVDGNVVNNVCDDYDFWYVGTADENGVEIYRKDKTQPDINNAIQSEWIDFRLIYFSNKIAKTYTIWPHSASKGWQDRIVKEINA